jgi:hypothetical protein
MDMLDRYLQAVKFFLAGEQQQDDIVRELSENLRARIDDREEELGRPLDEAELAAILRDHGHPMVVAGRYRKHQRLIGPTFFPLYVFALKMGLGVALLVSVVHAVVTAALAGDSKTLLDGLLAFPGRALMVFAWTTLGFAGLDLAEGRVRLVHEWDPRKLPKVGSDQQMLPRLKTLCELFFVLAAVVWLLLVPRSPFLLLGPAAGLVEYAPIWRTVYLPMVVLTLAAAVLHAIDFARPYRARPRELARIGINVVWLFLVMFLAQAGDLFVARDAISPGSVNVEGMVRIVNAGFQIGTVVAGVITVVEIWKGLRRLKRASGTPASPGSAHAGAGR